MRLDIPGIRVGQWSDPAARTGCTVVLFPAGTVASGEVRGGAPGTREWALLAPERTVARIDAFVLTGGSAFGLAACDGVVRWCEERGLGFPTTAGPVPIVVGAVIFDLLVGDPTIRPGAEEGYAACVAAVSGEVALGPVGVGAGATANKWRGRDHVQAAGLGGAVRSDGDLIVAALVAVNPFGGARDGVEHRWPATSGAPFGSDGGTNLGENTTIGVVMTNAVLDKVGCFLVAQSAHDGLARAVDPAHTTVDGDAFVAAATGQRQAPVDQVRLLAARAVEDAVRSGIGSPLGQTLSGEQR